MVLKEKDQENIIFLLGELLFQIKNSKNITYWCKNEIQANELSDALDKLMEKKIYEFNSLEIVSDKMEFVNVKSTHNFNLFSKYLEKIKFQIIPYIYYKNYQLLINDLEFILGISDEEISDEEISDEEINFVDCL